MKSIEQDTTTDAEHQAGGEYSHGRSEAIRSAQDAVDSAVRHTRRSTRRRRTPCNAPHALQPASAIRTEHSGTRKAITEACPMGAAPASGRRHRRDGGGGSGMRRLGRAGVRVPSSLCGIHIKAATLTPLLPPGKHVAVKPDTPVPDATRTCEVVVDKKVVLPSNASDANRERRRATSPWTNSPPTSPDPRRPARSRTRTRPPYPSPGAPPRTWSRRTSPPSSGSSNRAARMNRRSRT